MLGNEGRSQILSISLRSNAFFKYGNNNLNEICLKTGSICILKDSSLLIVMA